MSRIVVIGEDDLCCALGEKLVAAELPGWVLAQAPINTRGITKLLPRIPDYIEQARFVQPVLCIADTDRECAVTFLLKWLPKKSHANFIFRLAVMESESWLLADKSAFAQFLSVAQNILPDRPDELPDAKRALLNLAKRSKKRHLREELISQFDGSKPGSGYNTHLKNFVLEHWNARRAALHSPSLNRALPKIEALRLLNG